MRRWRACRQPCIGRTLAPELLLRKCRLQGKTYATKGPGKWANGGCEGNLQSLSWTPCRNRLTVETELVTQKVNWTFRREHVAIWDEQQFYVDH